MTESNGPDSVLDVRTLCFISPSRPFSSLHSQIPPPRSRGECPLSQPALDFSVKEWGEKMLLGKRPRARPPMARTTSMTKLTFDLSEVQAPAPSDPQSPVGNLQRQNAGPGGLDGLDRRLLSTVSPRHQRRNSGDFVETAHFLRACGLCKRRLVPGRDIYMYRGDSAFCSLECRQQQMNQDERKEKCSLASKKEGAPSTTTSEASSKGETLAAA